MTDDRFSGAGLAVQENFRHTFHSGAAVNSGLS